MKTPLFPLQISGALTRRHGRVLVGPVDLTLPEAESCVIMGPNGSGKTTLLRLLHGIARLHKGTISWACDIETARNAQSFIFQRPVILRRSVAENLIFPLRMRHVGRAAAQERVETWANRIGLVDLLDRPASVLSGGEQQKLAIARALITDPSVLFLDEPTASLDGRATREIEALLADARASGTALILATHDMGQARRLAERVVFLLSGKVHETGSADQFFEATKTSEARAFLKGDIVE